MSKKGQLFYQLVIILALAQSIIFTIPFVVFGADEKNNTTLESSLDVIHKISDDEIIKSVILDYRKARAKIPDLQYERLDSTITDLLYLFDSMSSEKSLKTLASLSFYYFGEHPHKTYGCLVRRKGNKIKQYFEELLKSDKDECVEKFGVNSKLCLGHDNFPTYKRNIRRHLQEIEKYPTCNDEELWNG